MKVRSGFAGLVGLVDIKHFDYSVPRDEPGDRLDTLHHMCKYIDVIDPKLCSRSSAISRQPNFRKVFNIRSLPR